MIDPICNRCNKLYSEHKEIYCDICKTEHIQCEIK